MMTVEIHKFNGPNLNLPKLLGFDDRISSRDLLSSNSLEIESARVLLRVPVDPTKRGPAPTLEPGQPDPFPTHQTPVRLARRRRRRHRRDLSFYGDISSSRCREL